MKTRRFRLTTPAKFLIVLLIIGLIGGGIYTGLKTGMIKTKDKTVTNVIKDNGVSMPTTAPVKTSVKQEPVKNDNIINLSLDEWIGWKSIIDANGGLRTSQGSIYDKLGIKVNINVINDATQSSNALIKGDLNAAGYTVNRTAFLSKKFTDSGVDVVMPYITNYSNGGDGIIATTDVTTVHDLVNVKIGVPQFSEAHSLVVWFVTQSDLTNEEKEQVISNLIFFETPDETAKAFFAGQIDVAATWQPYLTQAEEMSDCHVLFSTVSSSKLIMDGIVFRKDFAEANKETVSKFIDGALQARDMYDKEFSYVRDAMPMFSGASDQDISDMTIDAKLASWANNKEIMKEDAPAIFTDMCEVWASVGETVNPKMVDTLFDSSYLETLSDTYGMETIEKIETVKVTENNEQNIIDAEALLSKSASVNFIINTAKFTNTKEASQALDDFIKIAKLLDGSIIQIEGNSDANPIDDPEDKLNKMLSEQRAETVKKYFIMNGIDANRIIAIGNGSSKPKYENDTDEHRALNRRTDISFKMIEGK